MSKRKVAESENKENLNGIRGKRGKVNNENGAASDIIVIDDEKNVNQNVLVNSNANTYASINKVSSIATDQELKEIKKARTAAKARPKVTPKTSDECFKTINECLKKVNGTGKSSVAGEAYELPTLIGLEVNEFGPVSFPFVDPQATELIKICKQAPYGQNEKTILDKNVRDSFQLDPVHFSIKNLTWKEKLNKLVSRVAEDLGCKAEIEANIYKLLIYKQGGHFLKHRDTEKEKGMFGTLIIQLPSRHAGGELVVHENNGTKNVIDFGQKEGNNEYSIYFAAHYADLEHELLEVRFGYRIALVYSLCWLHGNYYF